MLLVSFFFTETLSYCSRLRVLMAIRPIEFGGMNEHLAYGLPRARICSNIGGAKK